MRVIAAYLLAQLGGNPNPDAAAINKILASVGIEAEAARVEKLLSEVKDKKIEDIIAAGQEKMQALPAGGGGGGAAPAAGAAGAAADKAPEPEPEPEEESDEDMGCVLLFFVWTVLLYVETFMLVDLHANSFLILLRFTERLS